MTLSTIYLICGYNLFSACKKFEKKFTNLFFVATIKLLQSTMIFVIILLNDRLKNVFI